MPEPCLDVSAPDFAVGTAAGVHNGEIWPSRAAPARAHPGTNEIVWVSSCCFCLRGNLTWPGGVKAVLA